jgi:hypothetical protein
MIRVVQFLIIALLFAQSPWRPGLQQRQSMIRQIKKTSQMRVFPNHVYMVCS